MLRKQFIPEGNFPDSKTCITPVFTGFQIPHKFLNLFIMHNFVITAAALSGNKGAESMFTSVYQNMSRIYPESHFYLLSYYPEADRSLIQKDDVTILSGTPLRLLFVVTPLAIVYRLFRLFKLPTGLIEKEPGIRAIARSDIVFDVGGITFSDGRELYLPFNIVTILPSILMKKVTVKCAQAMGPFNHFLNRVSAKWLLPRVDIIFARGRKTIAHLNSIGLRNTILTSDLAFSMNTEKPDLSRINKLIPAGNNKIVGITPSSTVYTYCRKNNIDYTGIMAHFCDFIIKEYHMDVILIPHSIRKDTERLKNNDLPVIRKIFESASCRENITVIDDDLNSTELREVLRHCDFFVASRFHSMVSALAVKVPLIVCGWGHKYREVLEQFGLEEYSFDYSQLSLQLLSSKLKQLIEHESVLRKRINRYLPEVLRNTMRHFEESRKLIEDHG
jgi:polysaccharide pyruvyl transferase WcaK-like protein